MDTTYQVAHVDGAPKIRPKVHDLPPDVLLLIFRDLLLTVRRPSSWVKLGMRSLGWDDDDLKPWPAYNTTMPERTFTETLGTVCRRWREIMASVSFFWTRLVIWVGDHPTSSTQIREYLAWSRDRPIDIYILEKPGVSDAARVKAQVIAVMQELAPQLQRWRVLHIELVHFSSLPRPRFDFGGYADMLEKFTLEFSVDDSTLRQAPPTSLREFRTPKLRELAISGLHFRESYVQPLPYLPLPPAVRDLSISKYDARLPPFPMFDLLTCLAKFPSLRRLDLTDLHLDCAYAGPSVYDLDPARSRLDWYADVHFTDMHGDAIREFQRLLNYPYVERVSYTRCSLPEPCRVGRSYYLEMDDIADPTSVLIMLAGNPDVRTATLRNCDGLRPDVLRMLSWGQGNIQFCPHLKNLYIQGCGQFSGSDLRFFLEARLRIHALTNFVEDGDEGYVMSSVRELAVWDRGEFSQEDHQWLLENYGEYNRPGVAM